MPHSRIYMGSCFPHHLSISGPSTIHCLDILKHTLHGKFLFSMRNVRVCLKEHQTHLDHFCRWPVPEACSDFRGRRPCTHGQELPPPNWRPVWALPSSRTPAVRRRLQLHFRPGGGHSRFVWWRPVLPRDVCQVTTLQCLNALPACTYCKDSFLNAVITSNTGAEKNAF